LDLLSSNCGSIPNRSLVDSVSCDRYHFGTVVMRVARQRPNAFVSLRLDLPSLQQTLCVLGESLTRDSHARMSLIRPEKYHITLALLCLNTPEDELRAQSALDDLVVDKFASFVISLEGVGLFGGGRVSRTRFVTFLLTQFSGSKVIYAKVGEGLDALSALASSIAAALPPELLVTEERAFQPHCTLWKGKNKLHVPPRVLTQTTCHGHMKVSRIELVLMQRVDPHDGFYGRVCGEMILLSDLPVASREGLIDDIYELERQSFPADEAASREKIAMRVKNAPELFLIGRRKGKLFGFVNGTAVSSAIGLTHDTMSTHDPNGDLVCVHSVVTHHTMRHRGYGGALVRYYCAAVARRHFALLCKQDLVSIFIFRFQSDIVNTVCSRFRFMNHTAGLRIKV
jgi:2'-5' RNA ligase